MCTLCCPIEIYTDLLYYSVRKESDEIIWNQPIPKRSLLFPAKRVPMGMLTVDGYAWLNTPTPHLACRSADSHYEKKMNNMGSAV